LQGHKWINTGAYSLGVSAFLGLGVAFFLVAVLGFLGAAAFLGLVAFFVAVFLGAWNKNVETDNDGVKQRNKYCKSIK